LKYFQHNIGHFQVALRGADALPDGIKVIKSPAISKSFTLAFEIIGRLKLNFFA
jgi:hypothetical protein